jgi:hypothetical protein
MKRLRKGDKKKFFGISFTWNGKYWVMDYINHIKNSRYAEG